MVWNWASNGPCVRPTDDTWVNTEQRWKDFDRDEPKHLEINLSQCRFVHHKPHMNRPVRERVSAVTFYANST
jgi:hypothetical protein